MNEPFHPKLILAFLKDVDADFPIPLSQKQDLHQYAEKLLMHGTLCGAMSTGGDKYLLLRPDIRTMSPIISAICPWSPP